ncbi:MAG: phosphotransferase family protein [Pseudomonadales bacterium]|nr:phosphotransferase family protein [Pseudomonadales bacterium]
MSNQQTLLPALIQCCQKYLSEHTTVENLRRLSGGASAETWQFELVSAAQRQTAILRRSAVAETSQFSATVSKDTEALVQKVCGENGIAVPEILFCLEPADALGEGYVMSCVDGETIPRKILRDEIFSSARSLLTDQCAQALAQIHEIELSPLKAHLQDQSPLIQLKQLEQLYRSYQQPSAVFEVAFRWLAKYAPQAHRHTLVHGDFRNGNLVVDAQGIKAILDWELCHLGDPIEDLGWLCVNAWCFGSDKPVGGFGDMETLISAYQKHSGVAVSYEQIRYWQVFGTLRWGVICLFQFNCFSSGLNRSVELAAIGRRVSETEIDLLNLIG